MSRGADGRPAVVLLSGGLDSTVTLATAIDRGFASHALTIDYGQRHRVELEAAARVAAALGATEHRTVALDLRSFGGSALTDEVEVPKGPRAPGADPIPPTYVPARNTIFLSLALAWAESLGGRDLFIGVSAVDYSGYPDCRPEFIEAFEGLANLGTRAADEGGAGRFTVHAPLVDLSKAETVRAARELGVDLGLTHSCYDPGPAGAPCRECEACQLRARGFAEAGERDPALGPERDR